MKIFNIILLASIVLLSACGSSPHNKKVLVGRSTLALKDYQLQKNIKWSGIVVQTVNNKDNTCFQVVETEEYNVDKPKYKALADDSRFILCKDGHLDGAKYEGRLITATADIVSYYKSKSEQDPFEYPILNAHEIKLWDKQSGPNMESNQEREWRNFNLSTPAPRNQPRATNNSGG